MDGHCPAAGYPQPSPYYPYPGYFPPGSGPTPGGCGCSGGGSTAGGGFFPQGGLPPGSMPIPFTGNSTTYVRGADGRIYAVPAQSGQTPGPRPSGPLPPDDGIRPPGYFPPRPRPGLPGMADGIIDVITGGVEDWTGKRCTSWESDGIISSKTCCTRSVGKGGYGVAACIKISKPTYDPWV